LVGCGADDGILSNSLPQADIELVRDSLGITHVYAKSDTDAFYGAGYAMARDRLFQMELTRRTALGKMAEVLGDKATKGDISARTMNFAGLGKQDWARMQSEAPDEAKLALAWIAGVNARIAEIASGAAPRPYGLRETELNFVPEPWTAEDSFAVAKTLAFGLSNTLDSEILGTAIMRIATQVADDVALFTMPSFDTFTTKDAPASKKPQPPPPAPPPKGLPTPYKGPPINSFRYEALYPPLASNNWAVSGDHTDTGRPYVCGDPHQAYTSPTRFWPLHMSSVEGGGTLDVIGFAFVGTPTVELGHNAHIGWTATTNFGDAMDLWDVKAGGAFESVTIGGEKVTLETRTETINVKQADGSMKATTIDLHSAPGRGVILPTEILPVDEAFLADGKIFFQWTGFSPSVESRTYLGLDRAQNLDDFEAAVNHLEVGAVNFMAASAKGIDYHVHAHIPDRGDPKSHPMPWHILKGDDAQSLWNRGFLPDEKLPAWRDPKRGFLVTANNDPLGFTQDGNVEDDPYYYGAFYDKGARANRIETELQRLVDRGKVARTDLEELQRDTYSSNASVMVPMVTAALKAAETDPKLAMYKGRKDLAALASQLEKWNGRFDRSLSEPVIFLGVEWFTVSRVMSGKLGPLFAPIASKSPPFFAGLLLNILDGRITNQAKYLPDGRDIVILQALDDTAQWLTKRFGAVDAKFSLGDVHGAKFDTSFGGDLEVPKMVVDGSIDTVNVSAAAFFDDKGEALNDFAAHEGSLYRMVTGFREDGTPEATFDFARGASGEPSDKHFGDQDDVWSHAQHVPLPFLRADVDAKAEEHATLKAGSGK
jgi:penicillin amidase